MDIWDDIAISNPHPGYIGKSMHPSNSFNRAGFVSRGYPWLVYRHTYRRSRTARTKVSGDDIV
ncbi:MAG: hypothetical protein DDT26_02742 [Dehalococcoidia bacterium]|nr:hypothetical protein [Chloroflexota bacterium]